MDLHGVVIGLASIIAVCGVLCLWVERKSAVPMDFIERNLGFSPDKGDGSFEAMLIIVLGMIDRHSGGVPLGV